MENKDCLPSTNNRPMADCLVAGLGSMPNPAPKPDLTGIHKQVRITAVRQQNFAEDPRVRYAVATLLDQSLDGFTWPKWLHYGRPQEGHQGVTIIPSGFFGTNYGSERSLPDLPLRSVDGIPLLFGVPTIERRGRELIVSADIIASAYFVLTRYEEWVCKRIRDEHGRFPGVESLGFRAGFLERPIVDEYTALLRDWCGELGIAFAMPSRRFSVLLTHDVDTLGPELGVYSAFREFCAAALFRKPWASAITDAKASLCTPRHCHNNISEVQRLDRSLQERLDTDRCKVIYFFMADGVSSQDRTYRIRGRLAREAMAQAMGSGAEIGLHASYSAGLNPARIASERAALQDVLRTPISMNRHHYLGWREPEDGHVIARSGIRWDSSLGYADVAGFRLGVCRPIWLFDPAGQRPMGIEEHPLVVMDCSLSFAKYMNLSREEAMACVKGLADQTRRFEGEFVVNWHNYFSCCGGGGL